MSSPRGGRRLSAILAAGLSTALAVALAVMINVATDSMPDWLTPSSTLAWILIVVLAVFAVAAAVFPFGRRARSGLDGRDETQADIDAIIGQLETLATRLGDDAVGDVQRFRRRRPRRRAGDSYADLKRLVDQWRKAAAGLDQPALLIEVDDMIGILRSRAARLCDEHVDRFASRLAGIAQGIGRIGPASLEAVAENAPAILDALEPKEATPSRQRDIIDDLARQAGSVVSTEIRIRVENEVAQHMRHAAEAVHEGLREYGKALHDGLRDATQATVVADGSAGEFADLSAIRAQVLLVGDELIDQALLTAQQELMQADLEQLVDIQELDAYWGRLVLLVIAFFTADIAAFMRAVATLTRKGKVVAARHRLAQSLQRELRKPKLGKQIGAAIQQQANESFAALVAQVRSGLRSTVDQLNSQEFLDEFRKGLPTVQTALDGIAARLDQVNSHPLAAATG